MGRLISLNARQAMNASATDDGPVMLIKITHATLPAPVYLSSDPTMRFSMDPLRYGTRHQGQDYDFVIMGAIMPDDEKDSPPKTTLAFENVAPDMAAPLRAISSPARIDLTVVMALSPDVVEARYTNLRGVKASYDADAVSLDISREPYTSEPWPSGRFSPARFPGLFP
ncbi:hypothetical protein [Methylobacterium sp. Leaf93]|uniref:hypothetical protein n=1 Tax=Methylobacterium sp. Leaf93 TaxID=1736249 RepID=UPI0006FBC312|nr:hypothetical protein [Methylobacterium sp. Leaf93]KQP02667.1 hypothetical protein ASF26_14655 [Methylobacterium sp. Leaf93]